MTREQDRDLEWIVRKALSSWRADPDYEDIVQEGMIRAWQLWERADQSYAFSSVATRAARWAATEFKRSQAAHRRDYTRSTDNERRPCPEVLSLDAMIEGGEAAFAAPDWSLAVLDRLYGEALWGEAAECCRTTREWEILWRMIGLGETERELLPDLAISSSRLHTIKKAILGRLRRKVAG